MTDNQLSEELRICFTKENSSRADAREILQRFKNSGGSQKNAQKILEGLRSTLNDNEIVEDIILDTLDLVVGWCPPHPRIWEH